MSSKMSCYGRLWGNLDKPRRHWWALGDVGTEVPHPVRLETLGDVWRALGDVGGPRVTL